MPYTAWVARNWRLDRSKVSSTQRSRVEGANMTGGKINKIIPNDILLTDQYLVQSSSGRLPLTTDGSRCRDPQPDIMQREPKLEDSIKSLP